MRLDKNVILLNIKISTITMFDVSFNLNHHVTIDFITLYVYTLTTRIHKIIFKNTTSEK